MAARPIFAGFTTLTLAATVLVAVATSHRSQGPQSSLASADAARSALRRGSLPPFGRAEELLREFCVLDRAAPLSPANCGAVGKAPELRVLIATVADPHSSNLDWAYDADLEAIRRGFTASGYLLDRFWLPARRDSAVAGGRYRPTREIAPGALLFRSRDTVVLLYLVHELPTGGVRTQALREALAERDSILQHWYGPGHAQVLRVIGPTFSGSSRSLASVLNRWYDSSKVKSPSQVVSGSATATENQVLLKDPARRRTFFATVHTDAVLLGRAREVMDSLLGRAHMDRVALLRESGTAYSEQSQDTLVAGKPAASQHEPERFPELLFPLNIGSVRGAYDGDASARESADQMLAPRTALSLNAGDTDDSPPVASPITPAEQELLVSRMVDELKHRRVVAVGLLATDVRDRLFLADVLRRRLPDVQLFTLESQALFLREEYARQLRGTLVFSTYPLILENQHWVGEGTPIAFGTEGAEGTFNATVYQLGHAEQLRDYGLPGKAVGPGSRPPVWLTAIASESFAPVSVSAAAGDDGYVLAATGPAGSQPPQMARDVGRAGSFLWLGGLVLGTILLLLACYSFFAGELALARANVPDGAVRPARRRRSGATQPAQAEAALALAAVAHDRTGALSGPEELPHATVSGDGLDPRPAPDRDHAPPAEASASAGEEVPALGGAQVAITQGAPWASPTAREPRGARTGGAEGGFAHRAHQLLTAAGGEGSNLLCRFEAERRELHVHRALYHLLRLILLAEVVLLPAAILHRAGSLPALALVGLLLAGAIVLAAVGLALDLLLVQGVRYVRALFQGGLPVRARESSPRLRYFVVHIMGEMVFPLVLLGYAAFFLGYVVHVWSLGACTADAPCALPFFLFLHRVLDVASGLSPLVPLTVVNLALALWCTWHLRRESAVRKATVFEGAWRRRLEPDGSSSRAGKPTAWRFGTLQGVPGGMVLLRDRLFLVTPNRQAVLAFTLLVALGAWLGLQIERTPEAIALSAPGAPFPSAFHWAFRLGVVALLGVTTWGVVRMCAVWNQLADVLERLAHTPLRAAFGRVGGRIPGAAQPSLLGSTRTNMIKAFSNRQWSRLTSLERALPPATGDSAAAEPALRGLRKALAANPSWSDQGPALQCDNLWRVCLGLDALWQARDRAWGEREDDPEATPVARAAEGGAPEPASAPETRSRDDRRSGEDRRRADPRDRWIDALEDFVAAHAVRYIEWTQESLRSLAMILLGSLLLTTVLLYSYPFYPDALFKLIFIGVLAIATCGMVYVTLQMSRDEVLSRIASSTPGKVDWDTNLVLNVVLFAVVPLMAFLGSEIPAIHDFFFAWLDPVLRSVQHM